MKTVIRSIVLLLLPFAALAQDAATVKQQADVVAKAFTREDYGTIVNYMHPKAVQMAGGKAKLLQLMKTGSAQMKSQGYAFLNAKVGTPGKFYKAGTEIHCLVPQTITIKTPKGNLVSQGNLLAISANKGKNWTFLDLNQNTISKIKQILPNFNPALQIPAPTQPQMQ